MKSRFLILLAIVMGLASMSPNMMGFQEQVIAQAVDLQNKIIDALLYLPHYGVFDNLSFKLEGTDVILLGKVMMPITKSEAERNVKKTPGIGKITNNIEVLPISMNDDSIRIRVYRKLFSTEGLYRYGLGAYPSIHIIVEGGRVTLEGVVSTKQDSDMALMAAREVSGIFGITNNLKIEK